MSRRRRSNPSANYRSAAPGEATGYGHDPSDAAEWKQIQKRVFTRWCNEQLKEDALEIEELSKDFCDGVRLVALIEALTEKKVGRYHKKPRMHAQRMENLEMALRLLAVEKIPLINIGAGDISMGNLKLILGLIWKLILHYQIMSIKRSEPEPSTETEKEFRGTVYGKDVLTNYVQNRLPSKVIRNFTSDWSDGTYIAALVDAVSPGLCPEAYEMSPDNALENAQLAMKRAEEWLGVPQVLLPEDLINPAADQQSIMTYVSQFPEAELKEEAPYTLTGDPSMVEVFGPGVERDGVMVHCETEFTVNATKAGKGPLRVIINGPEDTELQPTIQHRDGVYMYRYTPSTKGAHTVNVNWCGKPVPKSPFKVHVSKLPYRVSGSGVEGNSLSATAPAEILVEGLRTGVKPLIKVSGPNGQLPSSYITTEDEEEENRCTAFYVPPVAGEYRVDVLVAGKHIADSPYSVEVAKRKEGANMCFVKGPGVEGHRIESGKRTWFKVFTSGIAGHGKVEATVTGPVDKVTSTRTKISDAITKYSYTPVRPGQHTIVVKAGPRESESLLTFKVNVAPAGDESDGDLIDPDALVITGPGVSGKGAIIGQPAPVYVDTSKAGPASVEARVIPPESDQEQVISLKPNVENEALLEGHYVPEKVGYYDIQFNVASSPAKGFQVPIADPVQVQLAYQDTLCMPGEDCVIDCFTTNAGPGQLTVESGLSPVNADVKSVSDGHYQLVFAVPKEGNYEATVCYNGVPVAKPIQLRTSDSSKVQVAGPGIGSKVLAHKDTHFTVDSSTAGTGDIKVAIMSPSGPLDKRTTKHRPGHLKVLYTPTEPGDHTIEVTFEDTPIAGSPFSTAVIDPSAVVCRTDPHDKAELGQTIEVIVDSTLAGDGDLSLSVSGPEECVLAYNEDSTSELPSFIFTPSIPGQYNIAATFDEVPTSDDPISVRVTDISKVAVSGSGVTGVGSQMGKGIQLNEPADVLVDISESGPGSVKANLTLPTGSQEEVGLEQEEGGALFVGKYTPTSPGYYNLDILFDECSIPESPFEVRVVSPEEVTLTIGNAIVGEECTIDMGLSDIIPDEVAIYFKTPKGDKLPLEYTCTKGEDDDHCAIKFTPTMTGEMLASLYYSEAPMKNEVPINVIDPSKCIVRGHGVEELQLVGEETQFMVDTREAGQGSLSVDIMGPFGDPLSCKQSRKEEGVVTVEYVPLVGGTHTISVSYNNRGAPNSPFTVTATDPNKCTMYGPGLANKQMVGEETYFTIDTKEAGPGELNVSAIGLENSPLPTKLTEEEPGIHTVHYTPQDGGKVTLNVSYRGQPVPQSPTTVSVINPRAITTSLTSPQVLAVGEPVTFTVETSRAGSGELSVFAEGPEECTTACKKSKDGVYDFSFTPGQKGNYTIEAKFDDYPSGEEPIRVSVLDPSCAVVTIPDLPLFTRAEALFLVDVSNVGQAQLSATATMADGSAGEVTLTETDETGVYKASLIPTSPGPCSLELQYGGSHVGDSPYSLPVIDLSLVEVRGLDNQTSLVNDRLPFEVDTSRAGLGGELNAFVESEVEGCDVALESQEDGQYAGSITSSYPAGHKLHIQYAGVEVPGSPFLCPFIRPPPDASKVTVEDTVEGEFTLDARDAGGSGVIEVSATPTYTPARLLSVEHSGNFTFKVKYETEEDVELSIKWHGQHICGSPFSITGKK